MRKNDGSRHASAATSSPPSTRYPNNFSRSGSSLNGRLHQASTANRGMNSQNSNSLPMNSELRRTSHRGERHFETDITTGQNADDGIDHTRNPKNTSQAPSLVIPPGTRPPKVCSILQNAMTDTTIQGRRRNVSSPSKRRLQQQPLQKRKHQLPEPTNLVLRQVTLDAAVTATLLELLSSSFKPYSSSTNRQWESLELQYCRGHFSNLLYGIVAELTPDGDSMASAPGGATRRHFKRLCLIKPKPSTTLISTLGKALSTSASICLQELRIETSFSESMALTLAEGLARQKQSQWPKQPGSISTRFYHHANSDLQCFQQLRCLDLSNSVFETPESFCVLVDEGIAKNTTLQELHLTGCGLEDEDIAYLINNGLHRHRNRSKQDEPKTPLSPPTSPAIPSSDAGKDLPNYFAKIQELNLARNFCQEKAIEALFACSSTMHVSQGTCKRREQRVKDDTSSNNVEATSQNECWLVQSLRRLDISQQDVWDERSYIQEPLTRTLQDPSCRLEYLNLSYSFISDKQMTWLAPALSKNHSLNELDLQGNALDDESLIQLASFVLPSVTTRLEILNVCHNRFGLNGIQSLVAGMRVNAYLKQLIVLSQEELETKWSHADDCNTDRCYDDENFDKRPSCVDQLIDLLDERLNDPKHCLEMLRYYTCLNKGGRFLLRDSNAIALALWPAVLERALHIATFRHSEKELSNNHNQEEAQPISAVSNADVVYCLLRHGPVLLNR